MDSPMEPSTAILGDMMELGDRSDKMHFRVGKYAGKAGVDVIMCVGTKCEKTYMAARMSTDNQNAYPLLCMFA